jgi:hypothetical protein
MATTRLDLKLPDPSHSVDARTVDMHYSAHTKVTALTSLGRSPPTIPTTTRFTSAVCKTGRATRTV